MSARAFAAIPVNARGGKPRRRGLTEIRGPYYSMMGPRYLEDVLETAGDYVDGLKFAGGSFAIWGTHGTWGRIASFKEGGPG